MPSLKNKGAKFGGRRGNRTPAPLPTTPFQGAALPLCQPSDLENNYTCFSISLNVSFYDAKQLFKEPNKHFRNALEYRKRSKFSFI